MDSRIFEYLTTEDNGMKITLEFPCDLHDDSITLEVKSILAGILNEYLEKVSSGVTSSGIHQKGKISW